MRDAPDALWPAAVAAVTAAANEAEAAIAYFYLAVAAVRAEDQQRATGFLTEARRLQPDQSGPWINLLAGIGQRQPAVLALIPPLTQPLEDDEAEPDPSANTGEEAG